MESDLYSTHAPKTIAMALHDIFITFSEINKNGNTVIL
jgi:hypothetical protein